MCTYSILDIQHKSPRGRRDNIETIDMEMSDDDFDDFEELTEGMCLLHRAFIPKR